MDFSLNLFLFSMKSSCQFVSLSIPLQFGIFLSLSLPLVPKYRFTFCRINPLNNPVAITHIPFCEKLSNKRLPQCTWNFLPFWKCWIGSPAFLCHFRILPRINYEKYSTTKRMYTPWYECHEFNSIAYLQNLVIVVVVGVVVAAATIFSRHSWVFIHTVLFIAGFVCVAAKRLQYIEFKVQITIYTIRV